MFSIRGLPGRVRRWGRWAAILELDQMLLGRSQRFEADLVLAARNLPGRPRGPGGRMGNLSGRLVLNGGLAKLNMCPPTPAQR